MDKKSFYRILILVIFAAVVGGGILAWQYYWGPSEKQNPLPTLIIPTSIKTTNWKTYSNPEAKFTFKYPENWEVKADYYYQTSAGVKAVKPTIVLGPKEIDFQDTKQTADEKVLVINMRQYSCFGTGWEEGLVYTDSANFRYLPPFGTYKLGDSEIVTGGNFIATCSNNQGVLKILKEIADSFKVME